MANKNRIQALLVNYLNKHGSIDLKLPDGFELEIGITQETEDGYVKDDEYCWVSATREDRSATIDRYSMSLNFNSDDCCMIHKNAGVVDVI